MSLKKNNRYCLFDPVIAAKHHYGQRLEKLIEQSDSRGLWQGLRTITDYKAAHTPVSSDASLADELNNFFARFESGNRLPAALPAGGEDTPTVTERDVRRVFKSVNTRKWPPGLVGVSSKRSAGTSVYSYIQPLTQTCVIPTCFKKSLIVPVPKKPHPSSSNDFRPQVVWVGHPLTLNTGSPPCAVLTVHCTLTTMLL